MLDKELFIESLKGQFKDDVKMIVNECHHFAKTYLDIETLNLKLNDLHKFAINDGLTERDWIEVLNSVYPEALEQTPMAA